MFPSVLVWWQVLSAEVIANPKWSVGPSTQSDQLVAVYCEPAKLQEKRQKLRSLTRLSLQIARATDSRRPVPHSSAAQTVPIAIHGYLNNFWKVDNFF